MSVASSAISSLFGSRPANANVLNRSSSRGMNMKPTDGKLTIDQIDVEKLFDLDARYQSAYSAVKGLSENRQHVRNTILKAEQELSEANTIIEREERGNRTAPVKVVTRWQLANKQLDIGRASMDRLDKESTAAAQKTASLRTVLEQAARELEKNGIKLELMEEYR